MSLLRSWRNILEPTSYKYSVPNGTGCVSQTLIKNFRSCYTEDMRLAERNRKPLLSSSSGLSDKLLVRRLMMSVALDKLKFVGRQLRKPRNLDSLEA